MVGVESRASMMLLPENSDHGWAPYVWLAFLSFYYFHPIFAHASAKEWLITISSTVVFLAIYFGIFWVKPPFTYVLLICLASLGFGLARMNQGASVFIIFTASFIPWVLGTTKRAFSALAGLLALLAIDAISLHAPPGFWATSIVVALGVAASDSHLADE